MGTTLTCQSPWTTGGQQARHQCLLKLYDSDLNTLKLLDTVSLIGVMEYRVTDSEGNSQMAEQVEQDGFEQGLPTGVPVIHVLAYEKDYLMKRLGPCIQLQPENRQTIAEASEKIKAVLTLILGGDKVAAEYCLVSLISRVYKSEAAFMIGALPLNLTQITKEQAQLLQKFLMSLCPRLAIFESTVQSLNETVWQPKKSYDTNRVCTSVLGELPILSNLVIDETSMEVGELKEKGINNLKAIGELIED